MNEQQTAHIEHVLKERRYEGRRHNQKTTFTITYKVLNRLLGDGGASAGQHLGVGARATRLADFGGHGLDLAASADGVLHATARVGERGLLQLRLQTVLANLGLDVLGATRADLHVHATASITSHGDLLTGRGATAGGQTNASAGGGLDLGLDGLDLAAVADGVLHATASIAGALNLDGLHGLGGRNGTAGRSGAGGGGHDGLLLAARLGARGGRSGVQGQDGNALSGIPRICDGGQHASLLGCCRNEEPCVSITKMSHAFK